MRQLPVIRLEVPAGDGDQPEPEPEIGLGAVLKNNFGLAQKSMSRACRKLDFHS